MEAFATRITISEVRFPWFIPNINSTNNTIWLQAEANLPVSPLTIYPIVVPSGFYTWDLLTTTLNGLIRETTALNPPVVSTNGSQFIFTPGVASGSMFSLYWYNPLTNAPTNQQYLTQSSLALTMGFDWEQVSGGSNVTQALIGNPTELLYTQYVDIVSEKLNYYSQVKDGSSAGSTNKALICRLYISDEVSIGAQIGQIPTIIHRQFKNPKQIMWNKDAVIDFLDVSVLDQFGQLVPLPTIAGVQSMYPKQKIGAWPNFQITLLASEN
jgi:hypothetical protein